MHWQQCLLVKRQAPCNRQCVIPLRAEMDAGFHRATGRRPAGSRLCTHHRRNEVGARFAGLNRDAVRGKCLGRAENAGAAIALEHASVAPRVDKDFCHVERRWVVVSYETCARKFIDD